MRDGRVTAAVAVVSAVQIDIRLEIFMEFPSGVGLSRCGNDPRDDALPRLAQRPARVLRKYDQKPGPAGSARLAAAMRR